MAGLEIAELASIAAIGSALVGATGTVLGGLNAKRASEFEAAQMRRKAAEERAAEQRSVRADEVISRQLAVAATSGAGTLNPTVLDLFEDTAARGEYLARSEMFGAESRARGLKDQAKASEFAGENALTGSILEGFGDLLGVAGKVKKNPNSGLGFSFG